MAKVDHLLRTSGDALRQSSSIRPGPAGMASVAAVVGIRDPKKEGLERSKAAFSVPLDKIKPDPEQPRTPESKAFDDEQLALIANSLNLHGQINPITVIWSPDLECYRIVSGERRYRAASSLGWPSIACTLEDELTTRAEIRVRQVAENVIRSDLEPIEKAKAFQDLLTVNGLSVTEIARQFGISHSAVSQSLALLNLPESIQGQVESGAISPVSAYHVAKILDPEKQIEVAAQIIDQALSRDETVEVVRQVVETEKASKPKAGGSKGKGRGANKGKPKLPTERTIKTSVGLKVTVEGRKGIEPATMLTALERQRSRSRVNLRRIKPRRDSLPWIIVESYGCFRSIY